MIRGKAPVPYRHKYAGSVASLGLHKGVAQVYGIKIKGLPAWFMHRTYHVSRIPSFNRKVRVIIDWTLALFLKREVVSLGELHDPRVSFTEVTPPDRPVRRDGGLGPSRLLRARRPNRYRRSTPARVVERQTQLP